MCGIVGYVGKKRVVPVIIDGLRSLEYRGYDSAGIAVCGNGNGGAVQVRRAEGKLRNLEEAIRLKPLEGSWGIGHTRWATHGRPTEENAHPHRDCTGKIVVVHNGIVENYLQLKKKLIEEGHKFSTETDTEVIAHLIEKALDHKGNGHRPSLEEAVRKTVKQLTGVFALAVISEDEPNKIVAARNGPPVVIGIGDNEYFVASDIPALLPHTRDIFFLQDGDLAVITTSGVQITDFDGKPVKREIQRVTWDPIMAEKGGFKHFMLKEIYEQPSAVRDTTLGRVSLDSGRVFLEEMDVTEDELRNVQKINIAACGTSWHAALAGKFMIERLARIPVEVDYASEWRYRDPITVKQGNYAADYAVRRDRGYDCRATRSQSQRLKDAGHLQRGGRNDCTRSFRHGLYARRTGDRRGIDEGFYGAADRSVPAGALSGRAARCHVNRRCTALH